MSTSADRITVARNLSDSAAELLQRIVVWEWDAAADRVIASPNLDDVYGVTSIVGLSRGLTLVHPDDYQRHEAAVHAGVDRRRGYRSSFRIVHPPTSAIVWIEERAEAIDQDPHAGPLLIGLAFDATVRQNGFAPASLIATLDAVEEYGDALLLMHAAARRDAAGRNGSLIGEWVPAATHALTGLAALVEATGSDPADIIDAETRALKTA